MALDKITYGTLVEEIAKDTEIEAKVVKQVLEGLRSNVIHFTSSGIEVALPKLVKFKAKHVAAKRKGEMVRNPSTGEMSPRAEAQPAKFLLKATALQGEFAGGPIVTSAQGRRLKEALGV
jgi:nucleoid DNA-binding protein